MALTFLFSLSFSFFLLLLLDGKCLRNHPPCLQDIQGSWLPHGKSLHHFRWGIGVFTPLKFPRSSTCRCLLKPCLLLSQVCCRWRGTGSCSLWPTGRSPPWSRQSFLWSTWPSVTWAWPWPSFHLPSPRPLLTCEGAHTILLLVCSSIMSLGFGVMFIALPWDV